MPCPRAVVAAAALALMGCSNTVVNTGETTPAGPPTAVPTTTRPSNDKLVNAFDFYSRTDGHTGYHFTTPSGSWRCVIVPRTWAGCQSTGGGTGIAGAPQSVTDDQGRAVAPNAIVVRTFGDAQFASVPADDFTQVAGTAETLPFGKVLAAAGFRCNVQEIGIACISEQTDKGFTFSSAGVNWQYTDVP